MKIRTLEKYIRHTTIPYGDLLKRAQKGGLNVDTTANDGTVLVSDKNNNKMVLFFENRGIFENNETCGLIATHYNYSR